MTLELGVLGYSGGLVFFKGKLEAKYNSQKANHEGCHEPDMIESIVHLFRIIVLVG